MQSRCLQRANHRPRRCSWRTFPRVPLLARKIAMQRNWMMIPHVTQFGEADITTLEEFRQSQKEELEKQNIKLTPLVFIMKAVVGSLKAFPNFNASLDASGENLVMKELLELVKREHPLCRRALQGLKRLPERLR